MSDREKADITLAEPCAAMLDSYAAALAAGWSPDNTRDISAEQLEELRADPVSFLQDLTRQHGTVTLWDGRVVPRLPSRRFWISDGDFCGVISLRFMPGTETLPPYVLGHVGYAVIPAKRRRGIATRALTLVLPVARAEGLRHVIITCSDENVASRRVIEANGGTLTQTGPHPAFPGETQLLFRVPTGP